MTFAEAFALASEIAREREDSVALKVEAWRHYYGEGDERTSLVWKLWSARDRFSYEAPTAGEAIALYRTGVRPEDIARDEIAGVGVPEAAQ